MTGAASCDAAPAILSLGGRFPAVDLDFHFPVLDIRDDAPFKKRIIVVVEPHFLHNVSAFLFIGQRFLVSHAVHPLCYGDYFRKNRINTGGGILLSQRQQCRVAAVYGLSNNPSFFEWCGLTCWPC